MHVFELTSEKETDGQGCLETGCDLAETWLYAVCKVKTILKRHIVALKPLPKSSHTTGAYTPAPTSSPNYNNAGSNTLGAAFHQAPARSASQGSGSGNQSTYQFPSIVNQASPLPSPSNSSSSPFGYSRSHAYESAWMRSPMANMAAGGPALWDSPAPSLAPWERDPAPVAPQRTQSMSQPERRAHFALPANPTMWDVANGNSSLPSISAAHNIYNPATNSARKISTSLSQPSSSTVRNMQLPSSSSYPSPGQQQYQQAPYPYMQTQGRHGNVLTQYDQLAHSFPQFQAPTNGQLQMTPRQNSAPHPAHAPANSAAYASVHNNSNKNDLNYSRGQHAAGSHHSQPSAYSQYQANGSVHSQHAGFKPLGKSNPIISSRYDIDARSAPNGSQTPAPPITHRLPPASESPDPLALISPGATRGTLDSALLPKVAPPESPLSRKRKATDNLNELSAMMPGSQLLKKRAVAPKVAIGDSKLSISQPNMPSHSMHQSSSHTAPKNLAEIFIEVPQLPSSSREQYFPSSASLTPLASSIGTPTLKHGGQHRPRASNVEVVIDSDPEADGDWADDLDLLSQRKAPGQTPSGPLRKAPSTVTRVSTGPVKASDRRSELFALSFL